MTNTHKHIMVSLVWKDLTDHDNYFVLLNGLSALAVLMAGGIILLLHGRRFQIMAGGQSHTIVVSSVLI